MSVTLQLKPTEKIYEFVQAAETLNAEIEQEEERVRELLSRKIAEKEAVLLANCEKMGALDLALARAIYAIKHDLTKPEITEEHVIAFEDGRNLQVEDIIREKGKTYCPISLSLADGVTMITGANMGGKTISLKLAGQIPILAQYGFCLLYTSQQLRRGGGRKRRTGQQLSDRSGAQSAGGGRRI